MTSVWLWIKEKWKIVLGSILGLLAVLSVYLRLRSQKAVLQKANESHEKDNKLNEDALQEITSGLEDINSETNEKLDAARKKHESVEKSLQEDKAAFVKEAEGDKDLAKKLAEELGAKYVEKN